MKNNRNTLADYTLLTYQPTISDLTSAINIGTLSVQGKYNKNNKPFQWSYFSSVSYSIH